MGVSVDVVDADGCACSVDAVRRRAGAVRVAASTAQRRRMVLVWPYWPLGPYVLHACDAVVYCVSMMNNAPKRPAWINLHLCPHCGYRTDAIGHTTVCEARERATHVATYTITKGELAP